MRAGCAAIGVLMLSVTLHGGGPLTIVAPAAPGGGWDQTARALQHVFASVEPGSSVQVENVAGAAGTIGLARFVSAERGNPDALLVTGLVMIGAITTNHAPVSLSETTPIARLTGEPEVIVVPSSSRLRTLAELLAAFKASPSSIAWGGGSAGGTDHLLVRLIAEKIGVPGVRVNYIAFPGGGAALAALLGGQVTTGVSGYGEFAGQIEAGSLRALAVSTSRRHGATAVPTLREQGVDLDLANWRGVVAPPGLADVERDALTARVVRVATSAEWRTILLKNGWEDMLLTGPEFRQFLMAEQSRISGVLQRLTTDTPVPSPAGWLALTPATAPAVVITALVLVVVANLTAQRGRLWNTSLGPRMNDSRALALAGVLCVHALAFSTVGFVPASTALFLIAASLFGSHHWIRNTVVGFTTAALLYVVFTVGLGLTLPIDPLTRWLRN